MMTYIRGRSKQPDYTSTARSALCVVGNIATHYGRHTKEEGPCKDDTLYIYTTQLSIQTRPDLRSCYVPTVAAQVWSWATQNWLYVQSNICANTRQSSLNSNSDTLETKMWHKETWSASAWPTALPQVLSPSNILPLILSKLFYSRKQKIQGAFQKWY
jgi:hypothetical protein